VRNPKILVLEKDDSLADQVRGVAADLRPRPEVVACDRATAVEDAVSADGPFDVLIAGPSLSTKNGLAALQAIHDESPATSLVLAFAKRPDATLREIIRTGAMDLLQLPVTDRNLHDAVERAVAMSRSRRRVWQDVLRHEPGVLPAPVHRKADVHRRPGPAVR